MDGTKVALFLAGAFIGFVFRPVFAGEEEQPAPAPSPPRTITPAPEPCKRAIRQAAKFAEASANRTVDAQENLIDVAGRAFDLGLAGDEDEFLGGLLRGEYEDLEFLRHVVWRGLRGLGGDWLGWSGGDRIDNPGTAAEKCLSWPNPPE